MNKIVRKIQEASARAEEIRRVVEGVPPKIAEVRQAIAQTAGQMQKLRGDVMTTVGALRLENDGHILDTLREIDAHVETLADAGCRLERVDMDVGPTRRLIVHLERVAEVSAEDLQALHELHSGSVTIRALIGAIIKAEELAHKVELNELEYTRLTVELGLISTVRMGWRTHEVSAARSIAAVNTPAISGPTSPAVSAGHVVPTFSQSTYFEPRKVAQAGVAAIVTGEEVPATGPGELRLGVRASSPAATDATEGGRGPSARLAGDWRKTALDRFKKMPDLNRT